MLINSFHHPLLHDASWVRAMNINKGSGMIILESGKGLFVPLVSFAKRPIHANAPRCPHPYRREHQDAVVAVPSHSSLHRACILRNTVRILTSNLLS